MNSPIHEETRGRYTLAVYQDDSDTMNPQEGGDDTLFLIGDHRDFFVNPPDTKRGERWEPSDELERYKDTHHIFGLEAYIHSGVVLALSQEGNFPDRQWDVSQLGAVFVSKKEWKNRASAKVAALNYIKEWNDYLSGNVYGYRITTPSDTCDSCGHTPEPEEISSCWGFVGDYDGEGGALAAGRSELEALTGKKTAKV